MVNRYQEPYLFALSPISSMRSFAWTLEDKGTQEGRQLECHHTSPHILGVMPFWDLWGDFRCPHSEGKKASQCCCVIPKRQHATIWNKENKGYSLSKKHRLHCSNCQPSLGVFSSNLMQTEQGTVEGSTECNYFYVVDSF